MNNYRVSFYKDLLNSEGHNFKCLQHQIDIRSDDPSQALVLAEHLIGTTPMVTHLTGDRPQRERSFVQPVPPCK